MVMNEIVLNIELVYEKTCPNIGASRTQLLKAFHELDITPKWKEWEVSEPETPDHIHGYGSPTILVNGKDVTDAEPDSDDMCCRIYAGSDAANRGVPPVENIVAAIKDILAPLPIQALPIKPPSKKSFKLNFAMLPAIGAGFLPKLACPACWPAYAGLLSSMGIGFFDYTPYMLPAMGIFISAALFALVFRAKNRHGYKPFYLGLAGSVILLTSKFYWDSDTFMWFGLSFLIGSSVWNTWPKQAKNDVGCPACETSTNT